MVNENGINVLNRSNAYRCAACEFRVIADQKGFPRLPQYCLAYGNLLNVVIQNITLVIQRRTPNDRNIEFEQPQPGTRTVRALRISTGSASIGFRRG